MSKNQIFYKWLEIKGLEKSLADHKHQLKNLVALEILDTPISYVSYLDKIYKMSLTLEDEEPLSVKYVGTFEDFKELLSE